MMSSATGGEIAAFDLGVQKTVALGYRDGRFGLIETDLRTNLDTAASTFVPISKLAVLSKLVP